jgi:hypothetical protein
MWPVFYFFTVGSIATVLILIVDRFEPEHRYRFVLKFLIVCTAAAAIARHLMP